MSRSDLGVPKRHPLWRHTSGLGSSPVSGWQPPRQAGSGIGVDFQPDSLRSSWALVALGRCRWRWRCRFASILTLHMHACPHLPAPVAGHRWARDGASWQALCATCSLDCHAPPPPWPPKGGGGHTVEFISVRAIQASGPSQHHGSNNIRQVRHDSNQALIRDL